MANPFYNPPPPPPDFTDIFRAVIENRKLVQQQALMQSQEQRAEREQMRLEQEHAANLALKQQAFKQADELHQQAQADKRMTAQQQENMAPALARILAHAGITGGASPYDAPPPAPIGPSPGPSPSDEPGYGPGPQFPSVGGSSDSVANLLGPSLYPDVTPPEPQAPPPDGWSVEQVPAAQRMAMAGAPGVEQGAPRPTLEGDVADVIRFKGVKNLYDMNNTLSRQQSAAARSGANDTRVQIAEINAGQRERTAAGRLGVDWAKIGLLQSKLARVGHGGMSKSEISLLKDAHRAGVDEVRYEDGEIAKKESALATMRRGQTVHGITGDKVVGIAGPGDQNYDRVAADLADSYRRQKEAVARTAQLGQQMATRSSRTPRGGGAALSPAEQAQLAGVQKDINEGNASYDAAIKSEHLTPGVKARLRKK